MVDDFVRIASYTNVWEAELARGRLADEQIPAFLGNVNLVSWFWHYSNLVGGVTVHVARRDAEDARRCVMLIRTNPAESQPSWTCPSCSATVWGSWPVCWLCGASTDGSQALPSAEEEAASEPTVESAQIYSPSILALSVVMVLLVVLLCGGPLATLATVPFVVLFIVMLLAIGGETAASPMPEGCEEPGPTWPDAPAPKLSRVAQARVVRAWRAAVIGFFEFPPLGLYSLWLLYRLATRSMRLSRADRLRCRAAIVLDLCSIPMVLLLLALPLLALSYGVIWFVSQYFGSAGGLRSWPWP
jgi:hypothetical protein